ncbi:MAG: glycosyltransferase [Candidatus Kryptoniota bacterium]
MSVSQHSLKHIAVVGNYIPRKCGIATFTTDLCNSIQQGFPGVQCIAVPMNDRSDGYEYPPEVKFEIPENDITAYRIAADYLNTNQVDAVILQHEYGIFGGQSGSHVLELIRELRMPLVTTFHTILREPNREQLLILKEIADVSDRLVTMSNMGKEFLINVYGIKEHKIDVIPHGIPDVPFVDPNYYKDRFGVEGKNVLLTFGLLSSNKGIENVIIALQKVVEQIPNLVYIILGATHPRVKEHEGEAYRLYLRRLTQQYGVEKHVIFFNRFVSSDELNEFIGAADIYLTPYLNREQISSGTLSYALGAGKAIISTPYWYAQELLGEERGVLVPFRDPDSIADALLDLFSNEAKRHAIRKKAYNYGREMTWPSVAKKYIETVEKAREERSKRPRRVFFTKTIDSRPSEYPPLNLNHLLRLTDQTGILQHCTYTIPKYTEGYTTDDNARALFVAQMIDELGIESPEDPVNLQTRYFAFLMYAFNEETGRFRNFLSYERKWLEDIGSEDSHARAIWAISKLFRSRNQGLRTAAENLFNKAVHAVAEFTSPRAWSYSLIALHEYLRKFSGDRTAQRIRSILVDSLLNLYNRVSDNDWVWLEDRLTYDNGVVPNALIITGFDTGDDRIISLGIKSLEWLSEIQTAKDGHFVPIGSNGFYIRSGLRARFDQQPIEAASMISAFLTAYSVTGDDRWKNKAESAFEWFLGRNDLGLPVYDPYTGGCCDGIHPDRVNQNQGAESTLSFLISLLEQMIIRQNLKIEMHRYEDKQQAQDIVAQV